MVMLVLLHGTLSYTYYTITVYGYTLCVDCTVCKKMDTPQVDSNVTTRNDAMFVVNTITSVRVYMLHQIGMYGNRILYYASRIYVVGHVTPHTFPYRLSLRVTLIQIKIQYANYTMYNQLQVCVLRVPPQPRMG